MGFEENVSIKCIEHTLHCMLDLDGAACEDLQENENILLEIRRSLLGSGRTFSKTVASMYLNSRKGPRDF